MDNTAAYDFYCIHAGEGKPVDWALAYARAGMRVFSVSASKKPLTAHGSKDATVDEAVIRRWWMRWPHADVAWAVPVDVVVLDLDVGRGGDGFKDFIAREGVHPDGVHTPQSSTPRGGRHLIYCANGATHRNGVRLNGSSIDIRTAGGSIVLPGLSNGRAWLKPLSTPLAPAPEWVCAREAPRQSVALAGLRADTPLVRYAVDTSLRAIAKRVERATEGERNSITFWAACRFGELAREGLVEERWAAELLALAASRAGLRAALSRAASRRQAMDKATPAQFLDGKETLDRRPRFKAPDPNGELMPVMRLLDDCLLTGEIEPPMRAPSGWPVEVRAHEPLGIHELVSAGANDEEGETNSRLPPPKMLTLAPHTPCSMALLIEGYITFYRITKKDAGPIEVPRRLPTVFVNHYLNFTASRLPRVAAVTTTPLLLPNGQLLAANGLDRDRRIVFRIEPEIVELIPAGRAGGAAVEHAMKFLTDEWLIDVRTDYSGKCVLLALALTIIERPLFAERPAFFVTSGKRGGGKTTAINMIALATLGKRAAAMAWSRQEEERRKAVFAAFLQSVPLIVFDNIRRGAALSFPVIEKACTAAEMEDRVLKESRNERVACTAPMAFTGNNITPKGDLASRSLMTRIVVDRPDPENRTFVHPDPFQWTLDHRGEILEALYAVLIGNPRLYDRRKDEKTRFKRWQRMVGAAIEHAAELAGQGVDFAQLFSDAEGDDEETSSLAEAMECLDRRAKGAPFKSADVLQWTTSEDDDARILKAFLGGGAAAELTTKGVTRKLRASADAPTLVDDGAVWTLRATKLSHARLTQFVIKKAKRES